VVAVIDCVEIFLSSVHAINRGELELSNKDVVLLGALALQSMLGDCDEDAHSAEFIVHNNLLPVPSKNLSEVALPSGYTDARFDYLAGLQVS
jgi:hypothetical protein